MIIFTVVVTGVIPAGVGLFVIWMLVRLRRSGRPDRASEVFVGLWMCAFGINTALPLLAPGGSPWQPMWITAPMLLAGFGFLAYRLYRYRHAVLRSYEASDLITTVPAEDLSAYHGWYLRNPHNPEDWLPIRTVAAAGDHTLINGHHRIGNDQPVTLIPPLLRTRIRQ